MRIKYDFVTNSSSCCFLLSFHERLTQKRLIEEGMNKSDINAFKCMNNSESLIEYTESQPCDWVTKVTGPKRFWGMTRDWYEKSKNIIEAGDFVIVVDVERNYEGVETFERIINNLECNIVDRYFD